MTNATHFIEVRKERVKQYQTEVKPLDELFTSLAATKSVRCKTLFIWKIKLK